MDNATFKLRVARFAVGIPLCAMSFTAFAAAASETLANDPIVGRATVVDGDTIDVHGEKVRFNGIDAPESSQLCEDGQGRDYPCGAASAEALDEFLSASRPVTCNFVERDRYGRFVGDCFTADGRSVQEWMVTNGWALDWPHYSGGAYARLQENARRKGRGVWQGRFDIPWEWRAAQRQGDSRGVVSAAETGGESGCVIKGNINSAGERIYHAPGQKDYGRTKISGQKGERWFCSDEEAQAAGWRPALR